MPLMQKVRSYLTKIVQLESLRWDNLPTDRNWKAGRIGPLLSRNLRHLLLALR